MLWEHKPLGKCFHSFFYNSIETWRTQFYFYILVPRGRAPFGQHQEITTSGLVQRHSVFEWLCEHNRLKPEPIRFVRLDAEHAQSDGKSVIVDFRCWTRPEVAILDADQKERGFWGRECIF